MRFAFKTGREIAHLKHPSEAPVIYLPFDSDISPILHIFYRGGVKKCEMFSKLAFEALQFWNEATYLKSEGGGEVNALSSPHAVQSRVQCCTRPESEVVAPDILGHQLVGSKFVCTSHLLV